MEQTSEADELIAALDRSNLISSHEGKYRLMIPGRGALYIDDLKMIVEEIARRNDRWVILNEQDTDEFWDGQSWKRPTDWVNGGFPLTFSWNDMKATPLPPGGIWRQGGTVEDAYKIRTPLFNPKA